jgi:4'-phosphopantetheinyl transferase EntD
MAKLGLPPTAIPQAPDRSPMWPEGLAGSITHCDTLCIAALAPQSTCRSLGIDIEPATPLATDLEAVVMTPREWHALDALPSAQRLHRAKQIFCAKEALYKAQYPITGTRLGFQDVELELSQGQTLIWGNPTSALEAHTPIVTHIHVAERLVLASCVIT